MSDAAKLDDVLSRIEKRERSSRLRTILLTIIPTCLAAALIISYVSWMSAKQHELDVALREKREAEVAELKRQVQGLLKGPVQAYVRPVKLGGQLATAKNLKEAQKFVQAFDADGITSIRTGKISDILGQIRDLLSRSQDWNSTSEELNNLVLQIGPECKDAWEIDSKGLGPETIKEFNRTQNVAYQRAIETTKKIAASKSYDETAALRDEFWSLYWGELPFIETQEVASAMVKFGNALNQWKDGTRPADLDQKASAVESSSKAAMQ